VQGRYTNTSTNESISHAFIAANGKAAWIYQFRTVLVGPGGSGGPCPATPVTTACVVASHAIAFRARNIVRRFDTGAGELGSIDTSAQGRFLVLDKEVVPLYGFGPYGPVRILDAFASVETLTSAQTYVETGDTLKCRVFGHPIAPCTIPAYSTGAQVSDDLRLVATTTDTGAGWYEYSTAPAPK
jgi:hypothetical protein